ncbi:MAG: hypothetical protein VB084_09395 [Syntrophomonadaceae bacterium]|nr:hypothetical protein [Syntrophomonadaceae bacterium]
MSDDMNILRTHLQQAILLIKQAVDASVKIKLENPGAWSEVTGIWEEFIGEFWGYIKSQSVRSGQNLLRGISLLRFRP